MKTETKKNLEMVEEFLILVDKHGMEAKIDISVYGNTSTQLVKDTRKLFKERLRKETDHGANSHWLRMHNAPKKKTYTEAPLKLSVFYPTGVTKI